MDFRDLRRQVLVANQPSRTAAGFRSRSVLAWGWAALHPGDRLVHVLDFPEPEAGDQPAGLDERPIDDRAAGTIEHNRLALRGGLKAVGSSKMPLFEPASPAWHRNDERRFRKSTLSCKFFSAVEAHPRLSGWAHDHRDVGKLREQPTSVAHRPPIVEKNL